MSIFTNSFEKKGSLSQIKVLVKKYLKSAGYALLQEQETTLIFKRGTQWVNWFSLASDPSEWNSTFTVIIAPNEDKNTVTAQLNYSFWRSDDKEEFCQSEINNFREAILSEQSPSDEMKYLARAKRSMRMNNLLDTLLMPVSFILLVGTFLIIPFLFWESLIYLFLKFEFSITALISLFIFVRSIYLRKYKYLLVLAFFIPAEMPRLIDIFGFKFIGAWAVFLILSVLLSYYRILKMFDNYEENFGDLITELFFLKNIRLANAYAVYQEISLENIQKTGFLLKKQIFILRIINRISVESEPELAKEQTREQNIVWQEVADVCVDIEKTLITIDMKDHRVFEIPKNWHWFVLLKNIPTMFKSFDKANIDAWLNSFGACKICGTYGVEESKGVCRCCGNKTWEKAILGKENEIDLPNEAEYVKMVQKKIISENEEFTFLDLRTKRGFDIDENWHLKV